MKKASKPLNDFWVFYRNAHGQGTKKIKATGVKEALVIARSDGSGNEYYRAELVGSR